jgi:hypothetical protein
MTDQVPSNDARWQNVVFYKCCYHQADFSVFLNEISYKRGKKKEEDTKEIIPPCISMGLLHQQGKLTVKCSKQMIT